MTHLMAYSLLELTSVKWVVLKEVKSIILFKDFDFVFGYIFMWRSGSYAHYRARLLYSIWYVMNLSIF